mmetsp:Transcript_25380/g.39057  ORF Transcript_25380/g.39057 Transcript_25380/m.39057 type:complete len:172 (+) Transcript_25380:140-655(+)
MNAMSSHGNDYSGQGKAATPQGGFLGMLGLSHTVPKLRKATQAPPRQQTKKQDAEKAEQMFEEGNDYAKEGKWEEALAFYNATLVLQRRTIGKDHPHSGRTLNAIGVALTKKGDYYSGLTALEEALFVRQKSLGEGHPDVIETVNNMNGLLDKVHNKDEDPQQTNKSTKPA